MKARSISNWRQIIKAKKLGALSEHILGDLVGYRAKSLHRADDVDQLANLLQAVVAEVLENPEFAAQFVKRLPILEV